MNDSDIDELTRVARRIGDELLMGVTARRLEILCGVFQSRYAQAGSLTASTRREPVDLTAGLRSLGLLTGLICLCAPAGVPSLMASHFASTAALCGHLRVMLRGESARRIKLPWLLGPAIADLLENPTGETPMTVPNDVSALGQ